MKLFTRKSQFIKYSCLIIITFLLLNYFGVFIHLFEEDYYTEFHYPYNGDIRLSVQQLRHHEKPNIPPINFYNYSYISYCEHKCKDSMLKFIHPRLVYIVKSSADHFNQRRAIRNSWGYENRFSDVVIRTVFLLGVRPNSDLQEEIVKESQKYGDIIQADFLDTYFNNTIKTMIGFKWAVTYCPHSNFYMFVDDDMYVSTKNVLRFVRNPTHYPDYLIEPINAFQNRLKRELDFNTTVTEENNSHQIEKTTVNNTKSVNSIKLNNSNIIENIVIEEELVNFKILNTRSPNNIRSLRQVLDFELPDDVKLFAGHVFMSAPHRHKSSKWYITLDEYPYHMWPPYVTAGAFILSKEALVDMYYTSFYTKHFRFDDIYLGIVALKAEIEPFHSEEFYFYKKDYTIFNYHFVIASHGYDDPNELLRVWNEQKISGNA